MKIVRQKWPYKVEVKKSTRPFAPGVSMNIPKDRLKSKDGQESSLCGQSFSSRHNYIKPDSIYTSSEMQGFDSSNREWNDGMGEGQLIHVCYRSTYSWVSIVLNTCATFEEKLSHHTFSWIKIILVHLEWIIHCVECPYERLECYMMYRNW